MRKFEITDVSLEHQYFDVPFGETNTWTYEFKSLSNDEFKVVHYNIYGIVETLNNNDEVIKKLARFHENDHVGIIVEICVIAFKKYPIVIKDFDRFTDFIVRKYFENFQYFTEIKQKTEDVYYAAELLAEDRTIEQLNDILETIDE